MATLLFGASAVRRELLRHFFARPEVEDHVRGVARAIRRDATAVARELARLEDAGVLASTRRGNLRIYRLAASPLVDELRPLVQRTVGVVARLTETFRGLRGVRQAFIFGSHAAGSETASSDIDVMLVGEPDPEDLWERVLAAERDLGREVNLTEYTRREYDRLRRKGDTFITSVLNGPTILLAGEPVA